MRENRADSGIHRVSLDENIYWTDVRQYMQSLPQEQIRHSENVKNYMEIMADLMQKSALENALEIQEEYFFYGRAVYYHDIGKALISEKILLKPETLSTEEYEQIRNHPLYAEEIFHRVDYGIIVGMPHALFHLARDAAVYHHEWWNGYGYPYGLKKDEIPFFARAAALCDVYDAITGSRIYKKAGTHEYACREIESHKGTQFDPVLADIFLDHEELFLKEKNRIWQSGPCRET